MSWFRLLPLAVCLVITAWAWGQGMGGAKATPRGSAKTKLNRPSPKLSAHDVAAESGLTGLNVYGGARTKAQILEMTGNGVAVLDFNNDGHRDLLFVNGTRFADKTPAPHRLYQNLGQGKFRDVTATSGIRNTGWGQGACAGDIDNDGNVDLLLTYYGYNVLYRNTGNGSFEDITERYALPTIGTRWATGCAFTDYDRDGRLDLFVSNYVIFDPARTAAPGSSPFCFWRGIPVFCGPKGFATGKPILYHNENGKLIDVTTKAGIAVEGLHYGLGVAAADFDNDGWPDLYVACDSTPSLLYRNKRDGTFQEISVEAGTAYGESGQEQGSMGVAVGDYDNDGALDIVKTNFMDETSTLYRNLTDWFFEDATFGAGLGLHTKVVGWGVDFLDLDHDGFKDIFMANGHIYPEMETAAKPDAVETYRQAKILYWNLGNGAFRDLAAGLEPLGKRHSSRGVAVADLDGDGTLEAAVSNMNDEPSLYKFDLPRANAVLLELVGSKSNRSAIGARVTLKAGTLKLTDEVRSGGSYASQSDMRLHFGLGTATIIEELEIRWPNGNQETLRNLKANHAITIHEGVGVKAQRPFSTR
ncbi:MAG: CRTAC1 family protein [Bryobacterales bacterium]|nr:CRTAC1 family protein [Bryobacterales bacterium]